MCIYDISYYQLRMHVSVNCKATSVIWARQNSNQGCLSWQSAVMMRKKKTRVHQMNQINLLTVPNSKSHKMFRKSQVIAGKALCQRTMLMCPAEKSRPWAALSLLTGLSNVGGAVSSAVFIMLHTAKCRNCEPFTSQRYLELAWAIASHSAVLVNESGILI